MRFLTQLVYQKYIEITNTRRKNCVIQKKNDVLLENDHVGKKTMAWNFGPYWSPRKWEADITLR